MKDYEKKYQDFWKEIVENKDGTINKDQIMKELSDFSYLIDSLSKLYSNITGNMCSKPMTKVDQVLGLYEEQLDIRYDDGYEDGRQDGYDEGYFDKESEVK